MEKTLVILYSRTGNTRTVGEMIASAMSADLEIIQDQKSRAGFLGYIRAGREALKRTPGLIKPPAMDPLDYDLVIIGSPVWAGHMASPVRAYIDANQGRFKQTALFCTEGGSGDKKVLAEMAMLCGCDPINTLAITEKQLKSGEQTKR